jgi:hypothetical protein
MKPIIINAIPNNSSAPTQVLEALSLSNASTKDSDCSLVQTTVPPKPTVLYSRRTFYQLLRGAALLNGSIFRNRTGSNFLWLSFFEQTTEVGRG